MKIPDWMIKSYYHVRQTGYYLPLVIITLIMGNLLLIVGAAVGQDVMLGLGILLTLLGVISVIGVLWRLGYFSNPLKNLKFD